MRGRAVATGPQQLGLVAPALDVAWAITTMGFELAKEWIHRIPREQTTAADWLVRVARASGETSTMRARVATQGPIHVVSDTGGRGGGLVATLDVNLM